MKILPFSGTYPLSSQCLFVSYYVRIQYVLWNHFSSPFLPRVIRKYVLQKTKTFFILKYLFLLLSFDHFGKAFLLCKSMPLVCVTVVFLWMIVSLYCVVFCLFKWKFFVIKIILMTKHLDNEKGLLWLAETLNSIPASPKNTTYPYLGWQNVAICTLEKCSVGQQL